jgi:hypothetical protein
VYNAIVSVVMDPYGQFTTVGGHMVTMYVVVVYTVDVV